MTAICLYLRVHQPHQIRKVAQHEKILPHQLIDHDFSHKLINQAVQKSYIPINELLHQLIIRYKGQFRCALSISGTTIEQLKTFHPEALHSFKQLIQTGCVEIINETYYHSLCSLFSKKSFVHFLLKHQDLIKQEFGLVTKTFRNTGLIFNNRIAQMIESLGYRTILIGKTSAKKDSVFRSKIAPNLCVISKNVELSEYANFYLNQLNAYPNQFLLENIQVRKLSYLNLFLNYDIAFSYKKVEQLITQMIQNGVYQFYLPQEIALHQAIFSELNCHRTTADEWPKNPLIQQTLKEVYKLEKQILHSNNPELESIWGMLLSLDHFQNMLLSKNESYENYSIALKKFKDFF